MQLILANTDLDDTEHSVTASIRTWKNPYFGNMTMLEQFKSWLQLLRFKEVHKGHRIKCAVDNAKSRAAKVHSALDFGKSIGTRCPGDKIEYRDSERNPKILHWYLHIGSNQGKYKRLLAITKEFKVIMFSPVRQVQDLQSLLADRSASKMVAN